MSNSFWLADPRVLECRDDEVIKAIEFFISVVDGIAWSRRIEIVKNKFETKRHEWSIGDFATQFTPREQIDWYIFQAIAYANPEERHNWFEPEAFRVAPVFRRIGQLVPHLKKIGGIMDRVDAMMRSGQVKADDALFELLVAGAYKVRNWPDVHFHPEGRTKSHDLFVERDRLKWAVECKRINRSGDGYEAKEYRCAQTLAAPVHRLCKTKKCSLALNVGYEIELSEVPEEYLVEKVEAFLKNPSLFHWADSISNGFIQNIDLTVIHAILERDDVFFGSSRMIELLVGNHEPDMDYSLAADWEPSRERQLFATDLDQASIVGWMSVSSQAQLGKVRHFKTVVSRACEQLPEDFPAVIHVGYESIGGTCVDEIRHRLNCAEMRNFDPKSKKLKWVYGNYLRPEHTNSRNEACAMSETTAPYMVGNHVTPPPLANHLLLSNEGGVAGAHW